MKSLIYFFEEFNMKKNILIICLILFLLSTPVNYAQSSPDVTSYWGYVDENGIPQPDALITIYNASGTIVASTTSLDDPYKGSYQVSVPWDDPATTNKVEGVVSGETITFKVNGITVTSRVIDAKGTNNRLDLNFGIIGDFNGNGKIDIGDVSMVSYMVVGKIPQNPTADFNNNSRVDIGDASKIAYFLVGKVSEL